MAKAKKLQKERNSPTQASMTGGFALRARKRQQKQRVKKVSWRDEQVEGMSLSDAPTEEFTDPAILVIRENVKISYSKEELLKLREAPLSKKKPEFIDTSEASSSIWDPEKWGFERKVSEPPVENGPRAGSDGPSDQRRRPGDPRVRLRKENDGIVLSPQRRSFKSGCFVLVRGDAPRTNRSHSPLGVKNENSHMGIREIQPNTRRIGSGRILRGDSWDFSDKLDSGDNEYSYRGQQRNNNNDREDKFSEKYERRSFGRDFEMTRDRENNNKESRRSGKTYDRRRISDNREIEEPEWFSGGPMSQNDTIELRGFDDDKPIRKKLSPINGKPTKDVKKKTEQKHNKSEEKEEPAQNEGTASAPQAGDKKEHDKKNDEAPKDNKVKNEKTEEESKLNALVNEHSFNFDDILKCDTIPGLLTQNGVGGEGDNAKSRFSRWFKQDSPEKQESRRSSIHDDHHIIKNLLKEIGEVQIPGDSEAYFAPISPAANTGGGGVIGAKREFQQSSSQSINIIEMLQRGKQQGGGESMKQSLPGKILSLDELEAKIRQNVETSTGINQKHQQKPDEDMAAAFKKLMLNHSQQQDEAARMSGSNTHVIGSGNSNVAGGGGHHQHATNDLTMKLQQAQLQQQQKQQMDMLNKLINATTSVHPQQLRASPLHDIVMQQSRDLLNRPEAQAILQAMHQRIPSPRELQVHTQGILQRALIKKKLEEQQENYRKKQEMQRGQSPNTGGNPVAPKNVTSPTPLAFTPTSVLRKMTADKEEGKENKAIDVPPGRPLTGMRSQHTQPQVPQWNPNGQYMSTKHPGMSRPIVKANNFQAQEQFFGQQPQQQQQHASQQQQRAQQQQMAFQQQQQQRKTIGQQVIGSQFASGGQGVPQSQYNPQQYSTNQQFTQQQLRAQHQHRPANQQSSVQQQQQQQQQQMNFPQQQNSQQHMGGGSWQQFFSNAHQAGTRNSKTGLDVDGGRLTSNATTSTTATVNQLARWFSPDLLERARGGELPSTAGLSQHVLSLEEIERQTAPPVHN